MTKVTPLRLMLAVLLAFSMMLACARVAQATDGVAADGAQQARVFRGYMDEKGLETNGQTSFDNFLFVSEKLDGELTAADGKTVYCFNLQRSYPPLGSSSQKPQFTGTLVTNGGFHELAMKPLEDAESLEKGILTAIYNGYDNNAAGLKEHFGLSDGAFYEVTQDAVWHFTDSSTIGGASPSYNYATPDIRPAMKAAYQALIGNHVEDAPELVTVPEEMALHIYLSPLDDSGRNGYQHLLSAEPVHKETGRSLEEPHVDTFATTDNAADNKVVPAEGGKVTDKVTITNLEEGETYTLLGRIMDKDAFGKPAITAIGGKKEFVAGATNEVDVEFEVPEGYAGKELVVFEYLFKGAIAEDSAPELEDLAKRFVGKHEDINDLDQTVRVAEAPVVPPAPKPEENIDVPPAPQPPVSPETEEDVPPVPAPPAPIISDDEPPAPVPPAPTPVEEEEVPPAPVVPPVTPEADEDVPPAPVPAPAPAPKPSPKPADMGWIVTILTSLFGIGGLLYGITGTPTYQADRTPNRPEEAIKSYRPAQPAPAAKVPGAHAPAESGTANNTPAEAVAAGHYTAPTGVRGVMARTGVDITMFALALLAMATAGLALAYVIRRRRTED